MKRSLIVSKMLAFLLAVVSIGGLVWWAVSCFSIGLNGIMGFAIIILSFATYFWCRRKQLPEEKIITSISATIGLTILLFSIFMNDPWEGKGAVALGMALFMFGVMSNCFIIRPDGKGDQQ